MEDTGPSLLNLSRCLEDGRRSTHLAKEGASHSHDFEVSSQSPGPHCYCQAHESPGTCQEETPTCGMACGYHWPCRSVGATRSGRREATSRQRHRAGARAEGHRSSCAVRVMAPTLHQAAPWALPDPPRGSSRGPHPAVPSAQPGAVWSQATETVLASVPGQEATAAAWAGLGCLT